MRTKMTVLAAGMAAMLGGGVAAQPYDGIADCERHARAYYGRDADFRNFVIDRKTVNEITYDDKVGVQYIAAIWRGQATYTSQREKFTRTFICLHGGGQVGALFIHLLPR